MDGRLLFCELRSHFCIELLKRACIIHIKRSEQNERNHEMMIILVAYGSITFKEYINSKLDSRLDPMLTARISFTVRRILIKNRERNRRKIVKEIAYGYSFLNVPSSVYANAPQDIKEAEKNVTYNRSERADQMTGNSA